MPTEGQTAINRKTGERAVFKNGQWVKVGAGGKPQVQEASMRSRMDIGLAPMVQAQQDMAAVERQGNPYSMTEKPGNMTAKTLSGIGLEIPGLGVDFKPFEGVAKRIGGDDFQQYEQAAAAFESQLMPIMSGAAVSPSEAQRQIRASLPALGDSPKTLALKARTRQMMLNGAAKARGVPLPYPEVPTWGVNTMKLDGEAAPAASGGVRRGRYDPRTGKVIYGN